MRIRNTNALDEKRTTMNRHQNPQKIGAENRTINSRTRKGLLSITTGEEHIADVSTEIPIGSVERDNYDAKYR